MPTRKSPRKGSLQFWPRKRASKFLPRVNWIHINSEKRLKGFIGYKVGMSSAFVKDETPNSMNKGKRVIIPVTIVECPPMRIFSVRFYNNGKVIKEVLAENLDKELKKKIKLPKKKHQKPEEVKEKYDDIKIIFYSQVKKTGIKKNPDLSEIHISEVTDKNQTIDIRGLTKGYGLSGPVKRFGISLKAHKSEKGRRRPGSLGPWHPARVTFKAPMAGQLGMFSRIIYNNKVIYLGKPEDSLKGIKNYGDIKTDYIIVSGSVQGPAKRQVIITSPLRETKKQKKKNFEFIELR